MSAGLILQSCFPNRAWLKLLFKLVWGGGREEREGQPLGVLWNVLAGDLASWAGRLNSLSLSFLVG